MSQDQPTDGPPPPGPSPAPGGIERRGAERFEVLAQVRVKYGRVDYVMSVDNVSRTGAYVSLGSLEPPSWIRVGQVVELHVFVVGAELSFEVRGEIVRLHEDASGVGFGVRFQPTDDALDEKVSALVSVAAPKPPPLPRRAP